MRGRDAEGENGGGPSREVQGAMRRNPGSGRPYRKTVRKPWHVNVMGLVLLAGAACLRSEPPLAEGFEKGQVRTVVALGDSIVEGYGQPRGWPEMLQEELARRFPGTRIINAGVSGDNASDGLERMERDVLRHRPELVLVSFGLNDMKNAVPIQKFVESLSALVEGISTSGAQVVLLTTTRLQRGTQVLARANPEPYNDAIRELAAKKGTVLLDVWERFDGLNTSRYLMDAAHPNADGYRELARIVLEGLVGG